MHSQILEMQRCETFEGRTWFDFSMECISYYQQQSKYYNLLKTNSHLKKKKTIWRFTEEIFNGKLHFLCSVSIHQSYNSKLQDRRCLRWSAWNEAWEWSKKISLFQRWWSTKEAHLGLCQISMTELFLTNSQRLLGANVFLKKAPS